MHVESAEGNFVLQFVREDVFEHWEARLEGFDPY